ncbi:electron transfer flavoprotein FAD-binding domain protein [delta proteobacterium NaphS2]|nr:electron transfer flavoprotein FAD-binding domain protein [delta proteobacterium NaphS2]
MTNEIWVFGDLRHERLFRFSLNVLAKAQELSRSVDGKAVMVLPGVPVAAKDSDRDSDSVSFDSALEKSFACGAHAVYVLENERFLMPRSDVFAEALAGVVKERAPMQMLFALTDFGRETAARVACICSAGLMADCVDLRITDNRIVGLCPAWGGQIMAEITYAEGHGTGFATVHPQIQAHDESPTVESRTTGEVERIRAQVNPDINGPRLISRSPEPLAQRRLEEAEIVVVGGAGMGNMEGFNLVRELAAALGGEVAATRPPVLHHWVDEARLIGQTGKTVRPGLLISIGASGAIQYTAGITESKTIVAINRDKNAPIFQVADIGILGDAKTLLPLLTARAKQLVMRGLADVLSDVEKSRGEPGSFGTKIAKIRKSRDWSLEQLAKATGQTPEFLELVESDKMSPPVSFLLGLAGALGVDPGTFLSREEQSAIRDQRAQSFIKRTRSYSYETLTPGAEESHLRAFMVTIESHQAHKPMEYRHEGEEFIYVMEGDLEFVLGGKVHVLKKGESIHFNSDIPHKLKSLSNEPTRCLVMLYTV